ncbi:hypothetical protein OGATHE_001610 [Ogataea polymorpha]|uniref:Uncharacterized protein n=1 Tax=Ogataea polymorpha TaxID=460523 RepID=A0A9P8PPM3_9ASCO|nr:hypothetical protein OGATHE_001610 [Ogataea polymorpha]
MFNDGTITTGTWKFFTRRSVTRDVTHDRVEAALVGFAATTTSDGRYSEYMSFSTSLVPPTASSIVILRILLGFKIAMMYFMMFSVTTLAYSGELRIYSSLASLLWLELEERRRTNSERELGLMAAVTTMLSPSSNSRLQHQSRATHVCLRPDM